MFIKSNMETSVFYNKGSHSIELKPQTITYVDDTIVSLKELVDCYGDRITEISEEIVKEIMSDGAMASTGDEQVDAFLNGETNEVPEGTEIISEDEAKKLAEEQKSKETEDESKTEDEIKTEDESKTEDEVKKLAEEQAAKEAEKAKKNTKAPQTKSAKTGKGNK